VRLRSAVARFPQGDVGGAVFGWLLELDEAAAHPVRPEFWRGDLEVEVGLAARLRDLAPAGADLVALSGAVAIENGELRLPRRKPAARDPRVDSARQALALAVGHAQLPEVIIEIDHLTRFSGARPARSANW
jgi:hypothetical protein